MIHELAIPKWRKEYAKFYNYNNFKFKPFRTTPRATSHDVICVSRWNDGLTLKASVKKNGFWVCIGHYNKQTVVLDSKVIIALAKELQRLKREL